MAEQRTPVERSAPNPDRPARDARTHLIGVALLMVVVFGAGVTTDRLLWSGGASVGASSSFTDSPDFAVLQTTWNLIHDQYAETDAIDDRGLIYGAAGGMVDALGDDGHSRFLDPEDAIVFEESNRGQFTGIGVEIDIPADRPIVIAPIDGSPAAEAGIRAGDVILEVDGQSTLRLDREELSELMRDGAGTSVTLTMLHKGEEMPYQVTVIRRVITLEPVSWRLLPGGVMQLRLADFSAGATNDLKVALQIARDRNVTGIVLDLRDNPGGFVAEAIGVAGQFMPEGKTVFRQQGRDGQANPVNTVGNDGLWLDGDLVVLINGGSASAAEIVGSSLRDNGRAALIGETSYGTGTVLLPFEQPDGSIVLLGTALWLTSDGQQIWKQGVVPDETLPLPALVFPSRPSDDLDVTSAELASSPDLQLRAAVAKLSGSGVTSLVPKPPIFSLPSRSTGSGTGASTATG
ncbi:MAG: S41 family peptidase [Chloroflexota bacterium]|nr:S41 family peptidase [Chloroflexota bacterium]